MATKFDGNYTRILRTILNKSWKQQPTKQQLYGHLPPIMKTIQVKRSRHVGHSRRSRDELISDITAYIDEHRQDDQLESTHNSSVPIQDVYLKTYQKRWTIEKGGGRGSERSVWWRNMVMMMTFIKVKISKALWVEWPDRIIPKTQKWYLIPPYLKLSIIRYGSRLK